MKTPNILKLFITAFFAIAIFTGTSADAFSQRYLSEYKGNTDVKAAAQFADLLAQFIEQDNLISKKGFATDADILKLETLGRRIIDGSSNTKRNLDGIISRLKQDNRWNVETDNEFDSLLGNRRVKGVSGGARKIFDSVTQNFAALIAKGVNNAILDAKDVRRAAHENSEIDFRAVSFRFAKRGRFGCGVLFVGVAVAELAGAKLTAENIDKIFDRDCGNGTPTTE